MEKGKRTSLPLPPLPFALLFSPASGVFPPVPDCVTSQCTARTRTPPQSRAHTRSNTLKHIHTQTNILRASCTCRHTTLFSLCGRWWRRKVTKNAIFDREYYSICRSKYLHAVRHQKALNKSWLKMYLLIGVPTLYMGNSFILIRLIIKN